MYRESQNEIIYVFFYAMSQKSGPGFYFYDNFRNSGPLFIYRN